MSFFAKICWAIMKSNSALTREEINMKLYLVELIDNGGTTFEHKLFLNKDNADKYAEALKENWVYDREDPWIVYCNSVQTED